MSVQARRLDLQAKLEALLGSGLVYFQPPSTVVMTYPCIRYERDNNVTEHADNKPYSWAQRYQLTYMDYNPDSDMIEKLTALPLCAFNRHFATSGLNHDVFVIYH